MPSDKLETIQLGIRNEWILDGDQSSKCEFGREEKKRLTISSLGDHRAAGIAFRSTSFVHCNDTELILLALFQAADRRLVLVGGHFAGVFPVPEFALLLNDILFDRGSTVVLRRRPLNVRMIFVPID